MYEQDYMMRLNHEIIRTIAKLVLDKDMQKPFEEKAGSAASKEDAMLDSLCGQVDLGQIRATERELMEHLQNGDSRALEKALLFYLYLNDKDDGFLKENGCSREDIRAGLGEVASRYGLGNIIEQFE